jgi:hypothetical protein
VESGKIFRVNEALAAARAAEQQRGHELRAAQVRARELGQGPALTRPLHT